MPISENLTPATADLKGRLFESVTAFRVARMPTRDPFMDHFPYMWLPSFISKRLPFHTHSHDLYCALRVNHRYSTVQAFAGDLIIRHYVFLPKDERHTWTVAYDINSLRSSIDREIDGEQFIAAFPTTRSEPLPDISSTFPAHLATTEALELITLINTMRDKTC